MQTKNTKETRGSSNFLPARFYYISKTCFYFGIKVIFIFFIILHFYKKIKKIGSIYPHALFWTHTHIFFVITRSPYSGNAAISNLCDRNLKLRFCDYSHGIASSEYLLTATSRMCRLQIHKAQDKKSLSILFLRCL